MIRSLQAGRALAALAVVFHHVAASTATFTDGMPGWLRAICDRGYLGVDFFSCCRGSSSPTRAITITRSVTMRAAG